MMRESTNRAARVASQGAKEERGRVRFGDATIEYEVRRSQKRKKTIAITVGPDGGVTVAAPSRTPASELQALVLKRASWILSIRALPKPQSQPKRFGSGETLPYRGRDVPMVVQGADVSAPEVRYDGSQFLILAPHALDDGEWHEEIWQSLVWWYIARAAEVLPPEVERWWPRLGAGQKKRVLVRDQLSRWGSCSHDGTLRFNWRLMMLEPDLAELIVVHEMAHLTVKNHSPDFWGLVTEMLPDTGERRRRLREAGRSLPQ